MKSSVVIRGGAKAKDPGSLSGMVGMGMEGPEGGRRGTQSCFQSCKNRAGAASLGLSVSIVGICESTEPFPRGSILSTSNGDPCLFIFIFLDSRDTLKTIPRLQITRQACISLEEPTCQCRRHKRHGFNPWVRKIPWRRARQPTSVLLSGESHGQRSLAGYRGHKESDTTEVT